MITSKKKDYTNSFVPMNKKAIFLIRVSDGRNTSSLQKKEKKTSKSNYPINQDKIEIKSVGGAIQTASII